ncbi:MAG: glycosyltransferase [Planctomycetes bacterium]|nr:glycosyltransferase [Planctomycetota bacterium]
MTAERPRLVVFSDDWGRHPSSAQHLVRELLGRYDVHWVNTVGTRRPSLNLHDLKRGAEKLRAWLGPRAAAQAPADAPADARDEPAPTVHAPVHWPGFGTRLERALNRRLLQRALGEVLDPLRPPAAVITTASIVADLARALPELPWVYYCVDDLSEWPGLDAEALRRMELDLLPSVRRVIAVSETLVERLRGLGVEAALLTHGIDLAHWSGVVRRPAPPPGERPRAVYWGHADRRLDSAVCLALAEQLELVMVGPTTDVDPALRAHPHVVWRGKVDYAELPRVASEADVLVMPYADLPVTRAMQPLKLKEYLATLLPVVATPLPANRAWAAAMDLVAEPRAFAARALERARAPLDEGQRVARAALAHETWAEKARRFEALFRGEDEA